MLGISHSLASHVSQPQRFPLPAHVAICAEHSTLEVTPAKARLAAIAGHWPHYPGAVQAFAQPEVSESPQPWLSRLYARQPSAPSGGGAQVIGSSIFVSNVFGSSVIDRTLFDEEEG